jgi:hypothetical protein
MKTHSHLFVAIVVSLALALTLSADTSLGNPLVLTDATPITEIDANPDTYVGKTLQVKGKVTEVCEKAGCWMRLVDHESGKSVRIKVKDGEIVFPVESIGKTALAEGKFQRFDLTKEQAIARAKHEAEENGKEFNPQSITGPVTVYQIAGTGARILD